MKKAKTYLWLKTAGVLSTLIVLLIGADGCRSRRHMTKYGAPPANSDYNQTITKYGVPIDYDKEVFEEPDTTNKND